MKRNVAGAFDFRRNLTRYLIAAEHLDQSTVVTRNGHPAAVLVPHEMLVRLAAELRHGLHAPDNLSVIEREIASLERLTTPAADL